MPAYPLNTPAKPNVIPAEVPALDAESVGFHSVSDQWGVYGATFAFYDIYGFGGIRSTQPTRLKRRG